MSAKNKVLTLLTQFNLHPQKFSVVRQEGAREVSRSLQFYNLDAVISVGYRVNSVRATQFRQWLCAA